MTVDDKILALLSRIAGNQEKPHGLVASLQQQRSSLAAPIYAYGKTAANEPLVVDLPVAPKPGEHWIIDSIEAHGTITVAIPPTGALLSPVSGLFMIRQNEITESLADAQAGINFDARPVCLPILSSMVPLPTGWKYSIFYNGVAGKSVPAGWTIRLIINSNPGTPAPGPGALSDGLLTMFATREIDLGVLPG